MVRSASGYHRLVPASRFRCTACGNLTRFDVTTSRKVRAFHHYTVGGELRVEDVEVLSESVDEVACRWCGTGQSVIEITDADALDGQVSDGEVSEAQG